MRALVLGAALSCISAFPVLAQDGPKLDVPYVPTPPQVVEKMLDLTQVTERDYVVDLGSGDGRIAIAAAKRGAKAFGVDIDPERVKEAQENARAQGVSDKATFKEANLFETDFSDATVLTLYLYNSINMQLRPTILDKLKPGTRVVSHAFDMDDWKAEEVAKVDGRTVYFWIVPAKVEGAWKMTDGGKSLALDLKQSFQNVTGTATIDGKTVPITNGKLRGAEITFTIDQGGGQSRTFTGQIDGNAIKPSTRQGAEAGNWEANRAS
jgi:SAM-dependent methyltransferase